MVDLIGNFEEILLVVILAVALYFIWRYRSRFLALVTGDDRVHADSFDGIWYTCCRCCGTCTGDWSRWISCWPCWGACDLQHKNLVDAFGRWSGLLQWEIRISNVTVGDLPEDSAAFYYVCFEVGEAMPVNTAVTHLMQPKLIQFHGESVIKVRDASLDNDVRITVKDMQTFGSRSICEVYIRPDHLIDWAVRPGGSTMRFEMKPCNGSLNVLPAWILFSVELCRPWEDDGGSPWAQTSITVTRSGGQDMNFGSVGDLKSSFPLMNERGIQVREADERDAAHFQQLVRRHTWGMKVCRILIVLLVIASLMFRTAVTTCYREYKRVMVIHMHGVEFPPRQRTSNWVLQRCGYAPEVSLADHRQLLFQDVIGWQELLSGNNWHDYGVYLSNTASLRGHPLEPVTPVFQEFGGETRLLVDPNSTACNPLREDVIRMCYNLPIGARHPTFLYDIFTCQAWTCRYRMLLVPISLVGVIALFVVVSVTYCCHRANRRQMRAMHKKLVEQATFRNDSNNALVGHDSFHESSGCCGCGNRRAARYQNLAGQEPTSPYKTSQPGSPQSVISPQE